MRRIQAEVNRLRAPEATLSEVRTALRESGGFVRASAIEVIGRFAAEAPDIVVCELTAAADHPGNQWRLMGAVTLAHLAVRALLMIGTPAAVAAANRWREARTPQECEELAWWLRSEGIDASKSNCFRFCPAPTLSITIPATPPDLKQPMTPTRFATFLLLIASAAPAAPVDTTAALVAAVRDGAEGASIEIAAGTYELDAPLEPKARMTLKGAGMDKTVITHTAAWKPSTKTLPDPEMTTKGMDTRAYLIRLQDKAGGVTISDLTLRGPQLHGAVFGWQNQDLHLHHLRVKETLWAGVRTFSMKGAKIHDCEFVDAGGRWERGEPGVKGGITGGAIFPIWMEDCEIFDNRFVRTRPGKAEEFYGVKGRQGKRCRVHHNTIGVDFSIEFPFENDEDVEIDHNICDGVISIPKYAGGPVPKSGRTFHIHHNWMKKSYAIEFVRNGVEIDHNLFDFDPKQDDGNLISAFGKAPAKGPAVFHNNLVNNPGRGVIWLNEVFDHLEVRNNHIVTRTTATPRADGLFGFNPASDFKTITIRDNIIECQGTARPLLRAKESYGAVVENNTLTNVSDAAKLGNAKADRPTGPEKPLKFECGARGEITVDSWQARPTAK